MKTVTGWPLEWETMTMLCLTFILTALAHFVVLIERGSARSRFCDRAAWMLFGMTWCLGLVLHKVHGPDGTLLGNFIVGFLWAGVGNVLISSQEARFLKEKADERRDQGGPPESGAAARQPLEGDPVQK